MLRRIMAVGWMQQNTLKVSRGIASQFEGLPPSKEQEIQSIPIVDFEDPKHLPLPVYTENPNEPLEHKKQRLLYQSRKRGMLENDLLLSTFAAKYLKSMTAEQTSLYDKLINGPTNDWDIYYWAIGLRPTPKEYDNEMMDMFKKHVMNENREKRFRQPDL